MAELSDSQRAMRERIEGLIGAAAPFLDVVLAIGERISRIAEPTDHEYYPVRAGAEQRLPPRTGPAANGAAAGDQPPSEAEGTVEPARPGPAGEPSRPSDG